MSDRKQQNPPEASLRRVLHSAYSFVRSVEMNKATAALTLDHLIQEQIKSLKQGETRDAIIDDGGEPIRRPSRWDLLDKLGKEVKEVAQKIRDAGNDPAKLSAIGIYEASKKE